MRTISKLKNYKKLQKILFFSNLNKMKNVFHFKMMYDFVLILLNLFIIIKYLNINCTLIRFIYS